MIPTYQLGQLGRGNVAPSASTWLASVLTDSPAGVWLLDETAGSTAVDSSGNGRDGTYINSPTLSSTGVTLNGTNQRIRFPWAALDVIGAANQPYTVELFVTRASTPGATQTIWDKTRISAAADWNLFQHLATNVGQYQLYDGTNNPNVGGAAVNSGGAERQFVLVRDTAAGKIRQFVDGAQDGADVNDTGTNDYANTVAMNLGCRADGTDRFWAGKIRRLAVYFSVLNSARVAAHWALR